MHGPSFAPSAISLCKNRSHDPKLPMKSWALALQASHIPLHVHLWLSPTRQREHSPQASASVLALHKELSRRCRTLQRPLRLDFSLATASLINCHQTCMPGKQSNCHSVTPVTTSYARKGETLPWIGSSLQSGGYSTTAITGNK